MENNNGGLFKGIIVMILLALLACAAISTVKYVCGNYNENVEPFEIEMIEEEPMSLEEAMIEFRILKQMVVAEDVYYNLPEVIVEELFKKCGTMLPVKDYVEEYNNNKSYYISLQISKQLQKIGLVDKGVDGDNIDEITVKTKLKKPVNTSSAPLNVKPDTIQ